MKAHFREGLVVISLFCMGQPAAADVIADWNERAVDLVTERRMGPPPAERIIAMAHIAMFDAVNSIERRYKPYLTQFPASAGASKEAAAAAAAGTILVAVSQQTEIKMRAAMASYLDEIPNGDAKAEGIKIGEVVAARILEVRANDGSNAPDAYRPRTTPGVYVATPAMFVPMWPKVKPFAMTDGSQFRPAPPISLASKEWADDYNEIKGRGSKNSITRTPRQTEDALFWLATGANVYYPVVRPLPAARKLSLIDSARFYAMVSIARFDSTIAVFDAKYHYDFWRPVTAIRNGDIDENTATEREAAWQPISDTPMHPEYPCAHCILAASMGGAVEAFFGSADVPEVSTKSPTAPNVTHRWSNMRAFVEEVSEARISAGFHYRFSTRVGEDMGRRIAEHVVKTLMQPAAAANAR